MCTGRIEQNIAKLNFAFGRRIPWVQVGEAGAWPICEECSGAVRVWAFEADLIFQQKQEEHFSTLTLDSESPNLGLMEQPSVRLSFTQ